MLSDFKEERKREQNETKQQQQQKQTNETNVLGARIFSVSYLLSSSEAPLSREQRAQGAMGRHNVRRVIAAPKIPWLDSNLKYVFEVKDIWWTAQQKRNVSSSHVFFGCCSRGRHLFLW